MTGTFVSFLMRCVVDRIIARHEGLGLQERARVSERRGVP